MARTDERFRTTYNSLLDYCESVSLGGHLPAEHALATRFEVSRTTIRNALEHLDQAGIIRWTGRDKELLRRPEDKDRLPVDDRQVTDDELERLFLDWVLRFDVPPETVLNVTELARNFGVTAYGLQEFLASLSRFGLVRRRARGGWELMGFTHDYAIELSDFRMMLELNAVAKLVTLADSHPIWHQLEMLKQQHESLADEIDMRFHDFSLLDEQFHGAIGNVVKNRFVAEFQKAISLIFHYHYQWDKKDERDRNYAAIAEHLRLIDALQQRDEAAALAAAREHLDTSKQTLLGSMRSHDLA